MKNAWNQEINLKRRAKGTYRPPRTKTLQKSWRKTTKIGWWSLEPTRREREKKITIWKVTLKKSKSVFFKKPIHEFRLVENQPQSVETDRDSLSQILKISIGQKTEWTDQIRQRLTIFLRKSTIFEKQNDLTQSIEI